MKPMSARRGVVIVPDLPVDYIELEHVVLVNAEYYIGLLEN
ncbi:hypothetical protein Desgi_0042 [Desulfoscipio gibsoniae DSM 7213]|uniref:Uncharacterized protein n=1 Tax=Desulfoscipio gibsoniae DSM 7213 TaxID=767817 RepID=R4K905_9FIRM|nr:hypothetical protein Desgi_0042 [Desulfoscipio gibsoniae DSM 7213]